MAFWIIDCGNGVATYDVILNHKIKLKSTIILLD